MADEIEAAAAAETVTCRQCDEVVWPDSDEKGNVNTGVLREGGTSFSADAGEGYQIAYLTCGNQHTFRYQVPKRR